MVENDIKFLDEMMNITDINKLKENYFCWIYPFTNENIDAYYSKINFNNKSVLTVTSSGDHILNAIIYGCKDVDAFDSNPLAKYYSELKIAAIKTISYEEFIMFFYNKNNNSKYYFNKIIYDNFKNELNSDYRKFWEYVFDKYTTEDINNSYLFTNDFLNLKSLIKVNKYLNEKEYYILQSLLPLIDVKYYNYSFDELDKIKKKYDVIMLSNLLAFIDIDKKENIIKVKNVIDTISHNNSIVILCYLYGESLFTYANDGVYNEKLMKTYFGESGYNYYNFESSDLLSLPKPVRKILNKKDSVFIRKK